MSENNHNFQPLEDGETAIAFPSSMFKHKELIEFIFEAFRHSGLDRLGQIIWDKGRGKIPLDKHRQPWFFDGIECEVLKPNSNGWEKGKFRINVSIEFCPEILETKDSDLDSIRQNGL